MSIRLMGLAWDHAPLAGTRLAILIILCDHANDDGVCWPSIERVAQRARVTRRQAQRIVHQLADDGYVEIKGRESQTSLYTINPCGGGDTGDQVDKLTPRGGDKLTPRGGLDISGGDLDIAVTTEPPIGTSSTEPPNNPQSDRRPTAAQIERDAVDRCWAYWLEVSGKKQRIDDKRRRHIRNAFQILKASSGSFETAEQLVKQALLGLTRSPHHRGQNEQRREYMEIRYALKGIGDESDDERIEKAITWSAQYAPESKLDPAKVTRYLDEIRYTMSVEHRPERERAVRAYNALKAAGFRVISVDRPPWARLER